MLKRPIPPWKRRDHLFTPSNITKLEFASARDKVVRRFSLKIKPKPLPNGPIKHLMNNGVYLCLRAEEEFYEKCGEEALMFSGPQLPKNRSGEPDQFYLEG